MALLQTLHARWGGGRDWLVDGCGATETVGEGGDGLVVLEGIRQGDFPFLMAFLFEHLAKREWEWDSSPQKWWI